MPTQRNQEDANLKTIPHLSKMFNCHVGLSDHTMGIGVPLVAIAYGACVIEKHFCLSRSDGGVDSDFSLEPHELSLLVQESERAWKSVSKVNYSLSNTEQRSKQYRRSLYFSKDMKVGDIIRDIDIKSIRPGFGLSPKYFESVLNKEIKRNVQKGIHLISQSYFNYLIIV